MGIYQILRYPLDYMVVGLHIHKCFKLYPNYWPGGFARPRYVVTFVPVFEITVILVVFRRETGRCG